MHFFLQFEHLLKTTAQKYRSGNVDVMYSLMFCLQWKLFLYLHSSLETLVIPREGGQVYHFISHYLRSACMEYRRDATKHLSNSLVAGLKSAGSQGAF